MNAKSKLIIRLNGSYRISICIIFIILRKKIKIIKNGPQSKLVIVVSELNFLKRIVRL